MSLYCDYRQYTDYHGAVAEDVTYDQESGQWDISHSVQDVTKHQKAERDVLLTDEAIDLIREISQVTGRDDGLIFEDVTLAMADKKLRSICKAHGLRERSLHKLRKTYISILLACRDVVPALVRDQVGHKDLKTTYGTYTFDPTVKEKRREQLTKALKGVVPTSSQKKAKR